MNMYETKNLLYWKYFLKNIYEFVLYIEIARTQYEIIYSLEDKKNW